MRLPTTSCVEADGDDFVHSTSLNPVLVDSKLEDLDPHVDSALGDGSQLGLEAQHHIPR